jgi:hypothetical protein
MKKAQATPFIIIGIVVLIILFIIFFIYRFDFSGESFSGISALEDDVDFFEDHIQNCIGVVTLDMYGLVGGQLYAFDLGLEYSDLDTPLFYYSGEKFIPEKSKLELNLEKLMQEDLVICLEDFEPSVADSFLVDDVLVDLDLENEDRSFVKIDSELFFEGRSSKISEIVGLEFRIWNYFEVADLFVLDYIENEGVFCIDCFLKYYRDYGVTFTVTDSDFGKVVIITDEFLIMGGGAYEFWFAVENY